jgi:hypothetical protein
VAAEHVTAHDDRADVLVLALYDSSAGVHHATDESGLLTPDGQLTHPHVQPFAADAEWVLFALILAGHEAVRRH